MFFTFNVIILCVVPVLLTLHIRVLHYIRTLTTLIYIVYREPLDTIRFKLADLEVIGIGRASERLVTNMIMLTMLTFGYVCGAETYHFNEL